MINVLAFFYHMLLALVRHLFVLPKDIAYAIGNDDRNSVKTQPQISEPEAPLPGFDLPIIQNIDTTEVGTSDARSIPNIMSIDNVVPAMQAMDRSVPHVYRHFNKIPTCAKILVQWSTSAVHNICIDTGSSISIIDYDYLKKELPNVKINVGSTIDLRGVGSTQTRGWVRFKINFLAETDTLVPIDCVFHIVTGMSTKNIVGNDVLASEGACINLGSGRLTFPNNPGSIFIESWRG